MRVRFQNELVLVVILAVLLIVIISFATSGALRIILGLPFILFFPGYTLMAALFPRGTTIDGFERVALSFGFSVAIAGLVGLALNYTPWGVRLYPVVISLMAFIIVMSVIAWFRRRRLSREERYALTFSLDLRSWRQQNLISRVLTVTLIVVVLGVFATLGYTMAAPKIGERYTEFYILGLDGKTAGYPRELMAGEEGMVRVGIVNREHEPAQYQIEIKIDGVRSNISGPLVLEHDERWEEMMDFVPEKPGHSQKVEFLLYNLNNSDGEAYRQLHFWIDVTDRG
jgi:uncharacterized membrane protein